MEHTGALHQVEAATVHIGVPTLVIATIAAIEEVHRQVDVQNRLIVVQAETPPQVALHQAVQITIDTDDKNSLDKLYYTAYWFDYLNRAI